MSLVNQINDDVKAAMKAKDRDRLNAVRAIKSAVLLEATKDGASGEVEDAVVLKILQKLLKQRKDSAALYTEQGREDLASEEIAQAKILEEYLPEMLSEEAIAAAVDAIIEQVGASGPQDMGKVMGMATKQLAGKADNAVVAQVVKAQLNK